jgi:hypothetical protein
MCVYTECPKNMYRKLVGEYYSLKQLKRIL